jgi:hypothetical protein
MLNWSLALWEGPDEDAQAVRRSDISVLKEHERVTKTADRYRKHRTSEATFYNWKSKFGGMDVTEA